VNNYPWATLSKGKAAVVPLVRVAVKVTDWPTATAVWAVRNRPRITNPLLRLILLIKRSLYEPPIGYELPHSRFKAKRGNSTYKSITMRFWKPSDHADDLQSRF
jgi:hypothetical protein